MKKSIGALYPLLCVLAIVSVSREVSAFEIKSQYAKIIYNNYDDLEAFNNQIFLGKYGYLLKNRSIASLEDEVAFKIDLIVDKVKDALHMFPDDIHFKVAICGSTKELQKSYGLIYGKSTDFIAFYSPRINTVYFSVTDVEFQTLAHEFAHMIIEHYFDVSPPVKIHELLANFAEEAVVK